MTTKKPTKKTVAKKAAAKKAAPKKAAPKKAAPKKRAPDDSSSTEKITIKVDPKKSGAVIYAADIKNLSLRNRVYNWFRR